MIPKDSPSVLKAGSRTAICMGKGRKYWHLIPMTDGPLTVVRFTDEDLEESGYLPFDYPVLKAADKFSNHTGGLTQGAAQHLDSLLFELPYTL